MSERILVITVEPLEKTIFAITKLSPTKMILMTPEEMSEQETASRDILVSTFESVFPIQSYIFSSDNPLEVSSYLSSVFDDNVSDDNEICINLSHPSQSIVYGLLFGAYRRNENVRKIFYVSEKNEIIYLPVLSFPLSNTKMLILNKINEGNLKVRKIAEDIGITKGMAYNHIRELKDMGYLGDEKVLTLTDAGRFAII